MEDKTAGCYYDVWVTRKPVIGDLVEDVKELL